MTSSHGPPPVEVEHGPVLVEEPHRRLEVFKDNLEAFTIALVLALVIKHFCVEAFKIPTGSMMPTLYGERGSPEGVGDRILVDKWAYLTHGPERWDVVVFRYPLNQSKHFIKRVGGVGPEWLRIVRGDLWVRASEDEPWRLATKRRRVRDELYLPVYPPAASSVRPTWAKDPEEYWDAGEGWSVLGHGELAFAGGAASAIALLRRIGESTRDTAGSLEASGRLVHDVRFRMEIEAEEAAALTLRWNTAEDAFTELRLAFPGAEGDSRLRVERRGEERLEVLDHVLAAQRRIPVELECVDGEVHLHLGEDLHVRLPTGVGIDDVRAFDDFTQRFEIEAEGGGVRIGRLRVHRDIYHTADGMRGELGPDGPGLWIPEGSYFMLGDNTTGSSDSRKWRLEVIELEDGTEIRYEANDSDNTPTYGDDGRLHVTDHEGIERRWRTEDEAPSGRTRTERRPLVTRDLVVGRAFFVFWPLTPNFPGRAGFIH